MNSADSEDGQRSAFTGWTRVDLGILSAFLIFTLPITLPVLQSFFTFDDLENLAYYTQRPAQALWSNLVVFTSFRRPAGALFYLPSYWAFGLQPLPLYLTGMAIYYLNLGLYYTLVRHLTHRRLTAVLALAVFAFHPLLYNVLFNFGAVYELLAGTTVLAGLLAYRACLISGKSFCWLTTGIYLAGLNAKETVVVLPALLILYELLYVQSRDWSGMARRVGPLFATGVLYTLVKTLGSEAFWRTNPLYVLQFDLGFYSNLARYFSEILVRNVTFGPWDLAITLGVLLGLGLALRDRHLLFGLGLMLLTLLPVLFLPRVWALFLYIPLGGVALLLARLATLLFLPAARAVRKTIQLPTGRTAQLATALSLLVLLRLSLVWSAPEIRYARDVHFFSRTLVWKDFVSQLYRTIPSFPARSVLGFREAPFDFETADRWSLHFLVWLHYDPDRTLRIYHLPEQQEAFEAAAARARSVHEFAWNEGLLSLLSDPDSR